MKKIIFYLSVVIGIIILTNIINILITDLKRLTEYGYGYLVGKIVLFLVFVGIIILTRKHKIKSESWKTVYNNVHK